MIPNALKMHLESFKNFISHCISPSKEKQSLPHVHKVSEKHLKGEIISPYFQILAQSLSIWSLHWILLILIVWSSKPFIVGTWIDNKTNAIQAFESKCNFLFQKLFSLPKGIALFSSS